MTEENKKSTSEKKKNKAADKNKIANFILIAAIFTVVGFFLSSYLGGGVGIGQKNISLEEAQERAGDFVSNNLVAAGTKVNIKNVVEEEGLYKLTFEIGEQKQEIVSYLSKDGEEFFPEAMNIEEFKSQKNEQANNSESQNKEIPKTEKPTVEAFIMSYCPYGTQVQKGLLPVQDLLGDKIDLEIKWVDYIMHGQKETDENLRQYCIEKTTSRDKYFDYLECFLKDSESESCLASVGISESALSTCVEQADQEFGVTAGMDDKSQWNGNYPPFNVNAEGNEEYGVKGSPTLVINGVTASSARDPESLKNTICSAFTEQPAECDEELSTETPSAGFGEGTTEASSGGDCG